MPSWRWENVTVSSLGSVWLAGEPRPFKQAEIQLLQERLYYYYSSKLHGIITAITLRSPYSNSAFSSLWMKPILAFIWDLKQNNIMSSSKGFDQSYQMWMFYCVVKALVRMQNVFSEIWLFLLDIWLPFLHETWVMLLDIRLFLIEIRLFLLEMWLFLN